MTNCTSSFIQFSPLNRKKIQASFNGGNITSDGGLLLLREVDKRIGLTKKLSKALRDDRHAGYVDHTMLDLLRQRVYALAAGYEDINDHQFLRHDACFQTAVDREKTLASPATLSRFENAIDRSSMVRMSQLMVEHFIDCHKTVPEELILDFDPTDHRLHGHQDQRHYHGYYEEYCYLPLHVFCGDKLLVSYLRPSNIDSAKHAGAILRLLVKRLRQTWPNVKITFRADSAFARKRILYWCEQNNIAYIVGLAGNSRLKTKVQDLEKQAATQYEEQKTKQRLFEEYAYQAKSWKQERRVIAKVEHHDNGTNCRFVITNKTEPAETLYDQGYCPRGDMENGIKQLKLDLFSDRNSCHEFLANQFRILLSSLAYILMIEMQTSCLSETDLKNAYCGTLRLNLFKIGAIILKNTRRIRVLFSSHYPHQTNFNLAAKHLVPI